MLRTSRKDAQSENADQREIQDRKIEDSVLHFRIPGGDGSGTEMLVVELKLRNDELVGTIKGTGKDETGQAQTYTLSLKRAKTQWSSRRSASDDRSFEHSAGHR